jgi:hypothetical protein
MEFQRKRLCNGELNIEVALQIWCVGEVTECTAFRYAALAVFINIQFSGFSKQGHFLTG